MKLSAITREQSKDTGMAIVLLLLLGQIAFKRDVFLVAAIVVHIVNMAVPQVFRPLAVVWFGLSHLVGALVSRVLLSLVFGLVVTPIGLLRRVMGKDSLRLRAFKAGDESVMVPRSHTYAAGDLEKPY